MVNILGVCDSASVLNSVYIVKTLVNIICIGVPFALLVFTMINLVRIIMDASVEGDVKKTIVRNSIAAVAIFLVPSLVQVVTSVSTSDNQYISCWSSATWANIEAKKAEEKIRDELAAAQNAQAMKDANEKKAQQDAIDKSINGGGGNVGMPAPGGIINTRPGQGGGGNPGSGNPGGGGTPGGDTGVEGDISNPDNSNGSPEYINTTNLVYIDTTPEAIGCQLYYTNHEWKLDSLRVNAEIATQMTNILKNLCDYVAKTDWIPQLETAGAWVDKPGTHGKGLAIDLFNTWKFEANGKTYMPYIGYGNAGNDPSAYKGYEKFVCEVCGGKENCKYNINYIIYKNYFEGNGWCWGGNWSAAYYDGMHYEVGNGPCSTSNKPAIDCSGYTVGTLK